MRCRLLNRLRIRDRRLLPAALAFVLAMCLPPTARATTQLDLGDIAFTGYQSDSPDAFSFVLLEDVSAGTSITFTDRGWLAGGGFRSGEGTSSLDFDAGYAAGTQITVVFDGGPTLLASDGNQAGLAWSGAAFALSASGDQLFAYHGQEPDSTDMSGFLAAIQMNGAWDSDAVDTNTSAIPGVFTEAMNALSISPEVDNAFYDGPRSGFGTTADIRVAVNSAASWTVDDAPLTLPNQSFSLQGDTTPPALTVPPDILLEWAADLDVSPAATGMAAATDDTDPNPTIAYSDGVTQGSCSANFTVERTWTAADSTGNRAEAVQTIRVQDSRSPALSVPPDITLHGVGSDTGPEVTGMATAVDTCDPNPTVSYTDTLIPGTSGGDFVIERLWAATDGCGNQTTALQRITVTDQAPVAEDDAYETDEDSPLYVAGPGVLDNDGEADVPLTAVLETGTDWGTLILNADGSFLYSPNENFCGRDGFTYHSYDGRARSDPASVDIAVICVDDPPLVSVEPASRMAQYSDFMEPIVITAQDVDSADLRVSTDAPRNLSAAGGCSPDDSGGASCVWTLAGQVLESAATYDIAIGVADASSAVTRQLQLTVRPEDATVAFEGENPLAVAVSEPESNSSKPFTLRVHVREMDEAGADAAPGNLNRSELSVLLEPLGPGSAPVVACTPVAEAASHDYDAVLEFGCPMSGVPVNVYTVRATVGGGLYAGSAEDVLTVYDPSLGFTTGGGWFAWPGSGDKTNFGFSIKYNKKGTGLQGSLLLIRHMPDGGTYRIKSNALEGLALGDAEDANGSFAWAGFGGKATYRDPDWLEAEGNYRFLAYVEDRGEPGTAADRFWIEVADKDGGRMTGLSLERQVTGDGEILVGGNIAVPRDREAAQDAGAPDSHSWDLYLPFLVR